MTDFDLDTSIEVSDKAISVRELLDIDEADLNSEFACQAARYAYFAVLEAKAERQWKGAVRRRREEEALAFKSFKSDKEMIPPGGRTVSDDYASSLVLIDEVCSELKEKELEAQYRHSLMKSISFAFSMRANMLQSLGANLRAEQGMTGMSTKEISMNSQRPTAKRRRSSRR